LYFNLNIVATFNPAYKPTVYMTVNHKSNKRYKNGSWQTEMETTEYLTLSFILFGHVDMKSENVVDF